MSDHSDNQVLISKSTAHVADRFLLAASEVALNGGTAFQNKIKGFECTHLLPRFAAAGERLQAAQDMIDPVHQPHPEDKSFTAPDTLTPLEAAEQYVVACRRHTLEMAETAARILIESGHTPEAQVKTIMNDAAQGHPERFADAFDASRAPTLAHLCGYVTHPR